MGWWSSDIMGGDEPLDVLGTLCDRAGIEFSPDCGADNFHCFAVSREKVEAGMDEMVRWCSGLKWSQSVAFQVLGVLIMHVGAKMSDELKLKVIKAAEEDEWMNDDGESSERAKKVSSFIETVQSYKTEPTDVPYERLFEKLERVLGGES